MQAEPRDLESAEPAEGHSLLNELMTAQQIAEVLQMRVSTVEAYARRGLLPSIKLGRHRRFLRSQVEQAIWTVAAGQSTPAHRAIGGH
jgi:excisionase family DNA binding protein